MSYSTDHIATTLKNAREAKALSQRALSELAGVPQGHISKIENGAVDLRLSSLVQLARVLDLELALVPRKSISAVNSIVRNTGSTPRQPGPATRKELKRLHANFAAALNKYPAKTELAQFQRLIRDLENFRYGAVDVSTLRNANKAIGILIETEDDNALRHTLLEVKNLRNAAAHGTDASMPADIVRPAYSLEEDGDGD
jgi:transcriptional regulator with XRE-family HTH domain